ncbi:uncharacterized protein LOC132174597 [Corylus avellana]|uniref:uncharacterized protein LOC132174597 n=1 Tax=Corylus avellana TaxID=13451 RepID=UPI00286D0EDD|nr:uncharacterized protein LOC132174597 [Corylus avellana]
MAPVSWSDLPEELLESIFKKPTNVVNLYNCRYVCRSWRSVVDKVLASTPPHLLVYEKRRIVRIISFLNVFTGESRLYRLPKFKTGDGQPLFPRSVYSWHRWLVMDCMVMDCSTRDRHICLYNPFTRARIRLPAFKLDNYLDHRRKRKFLLSCEPKNPRSIGLAICDGRYLEKLMFWNPGDEEWTTFVEESMRIVDITSYKGGFCVLGDGYLKFIQFDTESVPHLKITYVLSSYYHPNQYPVESPCGDLLLVQLNIGCKIKIFKMDWKRKAWDEIKSLGDEAIFLSCAESVCIRAEDSTIFKPNCIYFTDGAFMPVEQKELGVYDIANQTVGSVTLSIPFDDDEQCCRWRVSSWFKVHVFWNLLETIKFKVYKLDWERMEWDEIKRLGEEAIFLCCDGSACIRADDYHIQT